MEKIYLLVAICNLFLHDYVFIIKVYSIRIHLQLHIKGICLCNNVLNTSYNKIIFSKMY